MQPSDRSAQIGALYQEMILDHYRRPRNKGELPTADESVLMKNPLCGDEIGVHVQFDGDTVSDLKFSGRGCSISQASASMMTQLVKGNAAAAEDATLGPARALGGVCRFPARVKCALLAWNALETALVAQTE